MKKLLLILLFATLTLAACGQSGPLYLPSAAVEEADGDENASEQEEETEGTTAE
jgi:predicted small lipoprotein YifL